MITVLTSFFNALSEGFKTLTSGKERQSETAVIKDRKHLEKAVNYAEKLIFHVDSKYEVSEDKTYNRLRRNFFRYN